MAPRPIRHVALLGGINVGGHRVTMDRLRSEVEALGFAEVSTFIASGNVLFTAAPSPHHTAHLADGLAAALGWPVPTYVRTAPELIAAVEHSPFGPLPADCTDMICFCGGEADRGVEALSNDVDTFIVHGHEVHWRIRGGVSTSTHTLPKLTKAFGRPFTSRNVNGLTRLTALLHG
jgi:uncharacterized protein (DUF1697 family)